MVGEKNFRWFGVKPFQRSRCVFSWSEFAFTVRMSSTPSGASSPRISARSSTGVARCASTDHIVTTSKPPAATSGTPCGVPSHVLAPPGRLRARSTESSERSTPKQLKPRRWATSRKSPAPQPKSNSRRPLSVREQRRRRRA